MSPECYITEDEFETNLMRIAATAGAFTAIGAGIALLVLWLRTRGSA
jgi:hypothetical protein